MAILNNTTGLPLLHPANWFFSYTFCLPSVKEWQKHLDYMALTTALPKFPWLNPYQPLAINPTCNYTAIKLMVAPNAAQDDTSNQGPTAMLADTGEIFTPQTAAETFHFLFKFFGNASQATSPNSKVNAAKASAMEQQDLQSGSLPDPQTLFPTPACRPLVAAQAWAIMRHPWPSSILDKVGDCF